MKQFKFYALVLLGIMLSINHLWGAEYNTTGFTAAPAGTYTIVKSGTISAGDVIIIVASGSDYAMSTAQATNNRGQIAIAKVGDNITLAADNTVQKITVRAGSQSNTFIFDTGNGYLGPNSSSNNYLKTYTTATADTNCDWAVSCDASGVASIVAQGDKTRNDMRHNSSNSFFSCYDGSTTSMATLSIYKLGGGSTYTDD